MNALSSASRECEDVFTLLKDRRNVLISGAPATGKSRLLSELAAIFASKPASTSIAPLHVPGSAIAIPAKAASTAGMPPRFAGADRPNRQVFRTAFHQGSKNRDFVSGLMPRTASNESGFQVSAGVLFRASEHAKKPDGASLLIIDEINRGPAVQVFGGSIVAIERDKRLAADGRPGLETMYFEMLDPSSGSIIEYALPDHLYLVAAMNQADASVEPLDVAFLRRWAPYKLTPDETILREYFGVPVRAQRLSDAPANALDVYEAAVQAWHAVNGRIRLGRGSDFELGHGVFMSGSAAPPQNKEAALIVVAQAWDMIAAHVHEVFFGDLLAIAATFNASDAHGANPYSLQQIIFADEPRFELITPRKVDSHNVYEILRFVSE